jgi:pilus assembly protein CpaB
LIAACVISGGCTYLLGRKLKSYNASQQQLLRYVAPAHALAAGEVLQAVDLDWTAWPLKSPLAGALTHTDGLVGRVVLYPVDKGQPLLERDMAAPGIGAGLGSRIPNGMRALALRSDEVVGVAGFLAPGSRLDVLVTYHTANNADEVTATVVQNAEVLAAGQQAEPDPTGKPTIATVVTLLLNPLDAERAVAASTQGTIHFVLRNALDKEETGNAPVSLSSLGGGATAPAEQSVPRRERGNDPVHASHGWRRPTGNGVETILGGDGASDSGVQNSGQGGGQGGSGLAMTQAPPDMIPRNKSKSGSSMIARSQP